MINITYELDEKAITSIIVKGHANQDVEGKDIVCSAVSAVIVGGANALKHRRNFQIDMKNGFMSIVAINKISCEDEIVMNTILTQLQSIAESSSQYVKITRKDK